MIIDVHVHFWDSFMDFVCPGIDEIMQGMERAGIEQSYLNSLSGLLQTNPFEHNRRIHEITQEYPEFFRGIAVVDPYAGDAALVELERCLKEYRFIGLKLHPWLQGYNASADFLGPILDLCRSYDVPVMFHTGSPPYAQVFEVAWQARRHPKVQFIFCHMGLNYQWRDAIETGKLYPNTYFETCGISYQFALKGLIKALGAGRVLFGSDNPFLFPETEILKIEELELSSDEMDQVLFRTARNVFKQ
jgi:predicted TIM-barrel fold metal-dependent hydrolase